MISRDGCSVYPVTVPLGDGVLGSVNCYLLEEAGQLTLIDAGMNSDQFKESFMKVLMENSFKLQDLTRIIITHHHVDHIGLANWITKQIEIPVYAHAECAARLRKENTLVSGQIGFYKQLFDQMGCGEDGRQKIEIYYQRLLAHGSGEIYSDIMPLQDDDAIVNLEAFETPGHSIDHIVFYDAKRKWLFSGDHFFSNVSSFVKVEFDSEGKRLKTYVQYIESLKKCLVFDVDTVFPGHGEPFGRHKDAINTRLQRIGEKAAAILELIKSGVSIPDQLVRTYYENRYNKGFLAVMYEIIGILDYLEIEKRIQKQLKDGVWHYYPAEA